MQAHEVVFQYWQLQLTIVKSITLSNVRAVRVLIVFQLCSEWINKEFNKALFNKAFNSAIDFQRVELLCLKGIDTVGKRL